MGTSRAPSRDGPSPMRSLPSRSSTRLSGNPQRVKSSSTRSRTSTMLSRTTLRRPRLESTSTTPVCKSSRTRPMMSSTSTRCSTDPSGNLPTMLPGRRFQSFKKSPEAAMLKKEMKELKAALHENVKVSDLPEKMQDEIELLKVHISKAGEAEIEKEFNDVRMTAKNIKMAKSVRNLKSSLERWAKSDEVAAIKKLDKAFWASPEGQELFHEMKDFHDALKDHVKKTKTGFHIYNEGLQVIEDEADDVEHEYKMLHGSKWDKAYDAAWKRATSSPEAASVHRRAETFGKSAEWKMLEKELKELDAALKKNVKVTDLPKDDMFLF